MRFSEEKIKQAILHPQLAIRQRALRYFSVCHSDDERVVPLVVTGRPNKATDGRLKTGH